MTWATEYPYVRPFDDGRSAVLTPMLFGKWRLLLIVDGGVADGWCYDDLPAALRGLEGWDGEDEPDGWMRHPMSGRRRPGGDPKAEYVNL